MAKKIWNIRRKEILKRALEVEKNKERWCWYDIPAYPAELVKLVHEGLIKIVGKDPYSSRAYTYQLTEKGKNIAKKD